MPSAEEADADTETEMETETFREAERPTEGWRWLLKRKEVMLSILGLIIVIFMLLVGRVSNTLLLITPAGDSIAFPDVEASFSRRISGAGIVGVLSAPSPSNACIPLQALDSAFPTFLLIERGDCNFVTKVENAQAAGYAAALVYNNEDDHDLVTMSGDGSNIDIPAVFISRDAGYILSEFVGEKDARVYLLPALETSAWSILAISSISFLAISAVLSTFFLLRRQQLRRVAIHVLQEPTGLSNDEIKALSTSIYNKKDIACPETCAICLEEFEHGETLRIFQCNHGFHVPCIDPWLSRRPLCPICKRDVYERGNEEAKAPEDIPLLRAITWHNTTSPSESADGSASNSAGEIC